MLRRDNEAFAARLKQWGKLEEISVMPSCMHGYMVYDFNVEYTKQFMVEEKQAFKCLVE